ncbi:hypothetical protein RKE29_12430, partial [Streptomyces sp. B1866]|nr:hypothetical protein [Streptomyces sp. B1866]
MADDHRDGWLDDDAVERLLRGEPVEARGAEGVRCAWSRAREERLAAGLGAFAEAVGRTPCEPAGARALPGEEQAVAAFRAARAGAGHGAAAPALRTGRGLRVAWPVRA